MARRPMSRWERAMEGFVKTRVGGWLAVHVANPIDRRLIPLTRGRIGLYLGAPVGVLETVGARSGRRRRTPLLYLDEGERVVLVASRAGSPRHPAWYHNLKANARVRFLRRGGGEAEYVAREATGPEREHLWAKVNELYAGYETYQNRTGGRRIPVVVLEPVGQPGNADLSARYSGSPGAQVWTPRKGGASMLWLILGIILLAIAIAGGAIVHPIIFVLALIALFMAFSGWRGRRTV